MTDFLSWHLSLAAGLSISCAVDQLLRGTLYIMLFPLCRNYSLSTVATNPLQAIPTRHGIRDKLFTFLLCLERRAVTSRLALPPSLPVSDRPVPVWPNGK